MTSCMPNCDSPGSLTVLQSPVLGRRLGVLLVLGCVGIRRNIRVEGDVSGGQILLTTSGLYYAYVSVLTFRIRSLGPTKVWPFIGPREVSLSCRGPLPLLKA